MKLTFFSRRNQAPKFSKVVAKSKKLVANFFFQKQQTTKKSYMKNVLYINAKLAFLALGIPEHFFSYL